MNLNILKILVHSASTGYGLCKIVNRLMVTYFVIINTVLKLLYNVSFTVQGLHYKGKFHSSGVADFKTNVGIGL
jgi:hypothetical protein